MVKRGERNLGRSIAHIPAGEVLKKKWKQIERERVSRERAS